MSGPSRFFGLVFLLLFFLSSVASAYLINEWEPLDVGSGESDEMVEPRAGQPWREPISGIRLLWIAGDCFKMGSAPSAKDREEDEGPLHEVCLSGYWLGETEVTQGQWQRVMRNNPAHSRKGERYPVENISLGDVEALTSKLNERYRGRVRFRLPTEAEWEYACRTGGLNIPFPGADQPDQLGWHRGNGQGSPQVVTTRQPNRLGLYDMGGNVWEWTADTYEKDAYSRHQHNDPRTSGRVPYRTIRGGGWKTAASSMRCANRGFERATSKRDDLGLRLAAEIDVLMEDGRPDITEMPF